MTKRCARTLPSLVISAVLVIGASPAAKATCSLPYTFTNGQTADASQVMANFNALLACVNSVGGVPGGATNSVQYNAGSGSFGGVGGLANGQLPIGSGGNPPQAATITAGPGISVTNGAGSITIGATGGAAGYGLYNQVFSATPTSAGTGLTTWLNQGGATVSDSLVGIALNGPSSGGSSNVIGRYMAAPATPYTITALIARTANSTGYNGAGIGWYDGTTKIIHVLSFVTDSGGAPYFEVEKWNSPVSFNGNDLTSDTNAFAQPIWLQISDNGTTVSFAFSQDGLNFLQLFSTAKSSSFLSATGYSNVVFFVNPQQSQTFATVMSWKKS